MLRMIGRRGCWDFLWYDSPYVNQIWYQFSIWYRDLIKMRMFSKVIPVILALSHVVTIVLSVLVVGSGFVVDTGMKVVDTEQRQHKDTDNMAWEPL